MKTLTAVHNLAQLFHKIVCKQLGVVDPDNVTVNISVHHADNYMIPDTWDHIGGPGEKTKTTFIGVGWAIGRAKVTGFYHDPALAPPPAEQP
jgi:hypothetical protein